MEAGGSAVGLRAADVDRDASIERLQEHFVAGRLESWELDDRVGRALRARSRSELDGLLADCQPSPPPAAQGRVRTRWIIASVAVAVVGGFGLVGGLPGQTPAPAQMVSTDWSLTICDTTGVSLPDDVECPEMSVQQEQLNEDADRALAAAEQLRELADGPDGDEVQSLLADANAAAEQARAAKADAQLVVATAPDGRVGKRELDQPARQARDAASDASRAVIRANRTLNR